MLAFMMAETICPAKSLFCGVSLLPFFRSFSSFPFPSLPFSLTFPATKCPQVQLKGLGAPLASPIGEFENDIYSYRMSSRLKNMFVTGTQEFKERVWWLQTSSYFC